MGCMGAFMSGVEKGGNWTDLEQDYHINVKECGKCPYSELFWSVFSPNTEKYRPE